MNPPQSNGRAEPTGVFAPPKARPLSRYQVVKQHAQGGAGEVMVARDEELPRHVALKRLLARHADDPDTRARFLLEAEITGGLEHPGIVPVYGLGQMSNGRPYYAMRLIRGVSLKDAIGEFHARDQQPRDPAQRALELRKLLRRFIDVCNAIQYAHSRGVLHRDIKPENVMLGEFGETLVVDWGLAKLFQRRSMDPVVVGLWPQGNEPALDPPSAQATPLTHYGKIAGTPAYMSPEQTIGLELTPASDVYSLGATLYTLLTGRPPFDRHRDRDVQAAVEQARAEAARHEGMTLSETDEWRVACGAILEKVRRGDFLEPRTANHRVTAALEGICLKAMAVNPADRFSSPHDLAEAIERWLSEEPIAAWVESVKYFEHLVEQHPHVAMNREALARNRSSLALVLSGMSRPRRAEEELRAAIAEYLTLVKENPTWAPHRVELAQVRLMLRNVLTSMGRFEQAEAERQAADRDLQELLKTNQDAHNYRSNLASVLLTLGRTPDEISQQLLPQTVALEMETVSIDQPPQKTEEKTDQQEDETIEPLTEEAAEKETGFVSHLQTGASPQAEDEQKIDLRQESTLELPHTADRDSEDRSGVEARYELVRRLGAGGLSELWIARDADLRREVVLKELKDPTRISARRFFIREARITSLLEHPNIPTVFGIGYRAKDDRPFFTMQWIKGMTLLEALRRQSPGQPFQGQEFQEGPAPSFDEHAAQVHLKALADVCDALDYAHRRGVVHRDPKPGNIILDQSGKGVLIDWGLASLRDAPQEASPLKPLVEDDQQPTESPGHVVGTPAYMAPEQARGDISRIDARTDVFAIGATLYHVLTGKIPFGENQLERMLARRMAGDTPRCREANRYVPQFLDEVCFKAMAPYPEDRHASARHLAEDIRRWLAEIHGERGA